LSFHHPLLPSIFRISKPPNFKVSKFKNFKLPELQTSLPMVAINKTAQAATQTPAKSATQTAQLKITLRYLQPFIWRRVLVPHDITLPRLHMIIQVVMRWTNSHLHNFETKTATYETIFDDDDDFDLGSFPGMLKKLDETKHRLCDLLAKPKAKCGYTYDFGDNWEIDIVLEKLIPAGKRPAHAEVIDGKNASPPDDCGGIPGYCDLVEILADPKHPEHKERREWLGLKKGEKFDPAHYDIASSNAAVRALKV
jgi:hypothetical protein